MKRIKFDPLALREMTDSAVFYSQISRPLGPRFLNEVKNTLNLLRTHPSLGTQIEKDIFQHPVRHFKYNVIYSIEETYIFVVAIAHTSRAPLYWIDRLKNRITPSAAGGISGRARCAAPFARPDERRHVPAVLSPAAPDPAPPFLATLRACALRFKRKFISGAPG